MQIDWWTLAIQAVNFLILIWLLWRFLYRPVKEVIEKRKALAEQAFADAEAQKQEAEAARRRYDDDRAGLAAERHDMLKKIHEELDGERRKVLEDAKRQADDLLANARQSIETERTAALTEIRENVAALAAELAAGLLRDTGAGASNGAVLEKLEREFEALPADERERLVKDLAGDQARLTVVTAAPLNDEERARWTERLDARLGRKTKIDFAADADILGGAELRFPHAVLKFTWADQLRKAQEAIGKNENAA
jgi:F-type H+-transporting ATPase subunit b